MSILLSMTVTAQKLKNIKRIGLIILIVAFACSLFFLTQDIEALRDKIRAVLEAANATAWSFPIVVALYLISCAVMFPIIVLNLATALVFGPVYGFLYAFFGTLISSVVFFHIGRFGRNKGLKELLAGPKASLIDSKLRDAGVIGVAALRLVPLAPYGLFNLCAGITSVAFWDYIAGTALAFLPGGIARSIVGDSLTGLIFDPSPKSFAYLAVGIVLWVAIIVALQAFLKKYRHS